RSAQRCSRFPYTTLFRSAEFLILAQNQIASAVASVLPGSDIAFFNQPAGTTQRKYHSPCFGRGSGSSTTLALLIGLFCCMFSPLDRKSTRLNSSHVALSY